MKSRIVLLFLLFCFFWTALVLRSAQLQILPDQRLSKLQKKQYRTVIELPARRGKITDRSGKELAVSIPAYSLFADPKLIKDPHRWAAKLSKKVHISYRRLLKKVYPSKNRRFVWIRRQLSKDQKDSIKKLKLKGIGFVEEAKRIYPNNTLLSQVLGFVGRDGRGLEGLERKFDKDLQGEQHVLNVERDARGRPLLIDGRLFSQAPSGADITLTVDNELQFVLEKALYESIVTHNADGAMGIILDAQTSEVLSMGYAPTYDLNRARNFGQEFWRNRLVTDVFEPGSVMKSILVAGALKNSVIKPSTKIYCEDGKYKIGKRTIREADSRHKFGKLSVSEILAKSSNIGTAKIAIKMGSKQIKEVYEDFGFNQKLSTDFLGEARGIMTKGKWSKHLQANMSFGHGIATTPLQVASAYAAIANGGVLKKPYIVQSIRNWENGELEEYGPKKIRRVLSASEAETMRLMLHQATEEGGTGVAAQVRGFPVAGKTGTAQKVSKTGGYEKNAYISSFAGMIPANNPKFVIYVVVDNPRDKYYGSEVAAPLFAKVASFAVRHAGIPPVKVTERNLVKNEDNKEKGVRSQIKGAVEVIKHAELNQTPPLEGLTLREVYQRLKGSSIHLNIKGHGRVARTIPAAGEVLPKNKTVKVILE